MYFLGQYSLINHRIIFAEETRMYLVNDGVNGGYQFHRFYGVNGVNESYSFNGVYGVNGDYQFN